VTDVHGELPPGLPAIQRRRFDKADDLGGGVHRSERPEVLGAERDQAEARGMEHRGVRSTDRRCGGAWRAGMGGACATGWGRAERAHRSRGGAEWATMSAQSRSALMIIRASVRTRNHAPGRDDANAQKGRCAQINRALPAQISDWRQRKASPETT